MQDLLRRPLVCTLQQVLRIPSIVATNLHYLELVDQPTFMSGEYFPTNEGIDFFKGASKFPKKKIKISSDFDYKIIVSPDAIFKTLEEYLFDYADREIVLKEYRERPSNRIARLGRSLIPVILPGTT